MASRVSALLPAAAIVLAGSSTLRAQAAGDAGTIATAVAPLPVTLRAAAGVERFDQAGRPQKLRPSRNGLVCLLSDTGGPSIWTECHQASYLPVVYRMRELAAAGVPESLADETIESEIRSGKLTLPSTPTLTYVLRGQLLHLPHASAEAIGVSTEDDGVHTYLMAPGTYFAHLMIPIGSPAPAGGQCIIPSGVVPSGAGGHSRSPSVARTDPHP